MKNKANYLLILLGVILAALGLTLIKTTVNPQGMLRALPYVCIGLGSGLFGHGMGEVLCDRALRGSPEIKRNLEIEQQDERNIAIANRAKGRAFDQMTFIFGALMVSFALMGVELAAVLLLVFAYLLVQGFALYYRFKFEREM